MSYGDREPALSLRNILANSVLGQQDRVALGSSAWLTLRERIKAIWKSRSRVQQATEAQATNAGNFHTPVRQYTTAAQWF